MLPFALPTAPRRRVARPLAISTIVSLHLALAWGLLQLKSVRATVAADAPLIVTLISPPAPERLAAASLPALRSAPVARPEAAYVPVPVIELQADAVIAPPPPTAVQPAIVEVVRPTAVAVAAAERPPATPPPAPPPSLLPPSAIEYLVLPDVAYPNASRRLNEQGLVIVAVLIDTDGLPRQVQLAQSSGFERLDQAALAGVWRARFKPYVQNGQPRAGWARIPIPFELAH